MNIGIFLCCLFLLPMSKVYGEPARVLFVGDSHVVGPFGQTLNSLLRKTPGITSETFGSCGTIAAHWLRNGKTTCGALEQTPAEKVPVISKNAPTPQIEKLVKDFRPNFVIVELGANYWDSSNAEMKKDLEPFLKVILDGHAKCFWVSMPDSRKLKDQQGWIVSGTSEFVKSRCAFFDSTQVTRYPAQGGDGIHYWGEATPQAVSWAKLVHQAFLKQFHFTPPPFIY